MRIGKICLLFGLLAAVIAPALSQNPSISLKQSAEMKQQILKEVDGNAKLVQVMIDTSVQLRRAWFPGVRDVEVPDRAAREKWL